MKPRSSARGRGQSRTGYAAKLLFQFRVGSNGRSRQRRLCEERIVVMACPSARAALAAAKRSGESACYAYRNSDGQPVHFEFVGVLDLLKLGPECQPNEVWYDVRRMLNPMKRKRQILPPEEELIERTAER